MKKLLIFLLALGCAQGFAQVATQQNVPDVNYDYNSLRTHAFGQLDMSASKIPSGFLMEYSLVGFAHAERDGLASDPPMSHVDNFAMVYASLAYGKVNANGALADYAQLEATAQALYDTDRTIAIMMLDKKYHRLKDDAVSQGLIQLESDGLQFKPVSTAPGSAAYPFIEDRAFAIAIWENTISSHEDLKFEMAVLIYSTKNDYHLINFEHKIIISAAI